MSEGQVASSINRDNDTIFKTVFVYMGQAFVHWDTLSVELNKQILGEI